MTWDQRPNLERRPHRPKRGAAAAVAEVGAVTEAFPPDGHGRPSYACITGSFDNQASNVHYAYRHEQLADQPQQQWFAESS